MVRCTNLVGRFDGELQVEVQPVHEDGEELVRVLLLTATKRPLVFTDLVLNKRLY